MPTVFFTRSAADIQWAELAELICSNPNDKSQIVKLLLKSLPLLTGSSMKEWFNPFKNISKGTLRVKDYWLQFEWQHRRSPHIHMYLTSWYQPKSSIATKQSRCQSNSKTSNRSTCMQQTFLEAMQNITEDLIQLIATCERHSMCSEAYCLKSVDGRPVCMLLQFSQTIGTNEWSRFQWGWWFDIDYIQKWSPDQQLQSNSVVQLESQCGYAILYVEEDGHVAKYATKSENRSESLNDIYATIVQNLKDDEFISYWWKLSKKDFSAQEICHLL